MKVRKDIIRKPNYLIDYFVSLIIVLAVLMALAMGVCLVRYVSYYYETEDEKEFYDVTGEIDEVIFENDFLKEELVSSDISKIKAALVNHYSETGQKVRYDFRGIGEVDSSKTAILYYSYYDGDLKTEEIKSYIMSKSYILRLADDKYMEYFNTQEVKDMQGITDVGSECLEQSPENFFSCSKFYANLDEGLFIPVEFEICTISNGGNIVPTGKVITIEPDNTEGFTLVNALEGVNLIHGIVAGFEGADNDEDYVHGDYIESEGLVRKSEWSEYKVIPFTTKFKSQITIGLVVVIWVSFGLAFIPATIVYNVRMRRYQVYEMRSRMIDAMAHDLKTPMAAISAYAENLSNHIGGDKQEYYAGKIEEKVSQMNKMVNDILEFSKSEKTQTAVNKEEVDISAVISQIISDNEQMIEDKSLKVKYGKKDIKIITDREIFRQAISNLIGNAVLYSKEGSDINISLDEKRLLIINVTAEKIESVEGLKDPFAKGSSTRGNRGTGLGLAIADNNLAMLGMKLDIRSEEDKFIAEVKI